MLVGLTKPQITCLASMFPGGCVIRPFLKMEDHHTYIHASGGGGYNSDGVLIRGDGQTLGITWETLDALPRRREQ